VECLEKVRRWEFIPLWSFNYPTGPSIELPKSFTPFFASNVNDAYYLDFLALFIEKDELIHSPEK
jgi:hypothetical protein